ncbi:magnesium transporter [Candidatus Izemoplasma sp. B36]|uniref:magnesium transporter n=1 Tax=Candidatus Izemoplasma sp. B36 TaxID=3242468 RepID=UPI003558BB63
MNEVLQIDTTQEIINLIDSTLPIESLQEKINEYHDYEIAKALVEMTKEQRQVLYTLLPNKNLADVFEEIDPEDAFWILEETSLSVITRIFSEMEVDDLVDILGYCLDEEDKITYLSLINVSDRKIVKTLLNYDDSLVGSIMNNTFIDVLKTDTVKQAIKKVVTEAPENEFINNIYVTDNDKLIGALSLKELISAGNNKDQTIEDIMSENLFYVYPSTKNEDAIVMMQNYDFQLLPVVDKYLNLIGVITFDDMMDTLSHESEMDYSSLAGLSEVSVDERETVWETIKKRMPWLLVLLFINLITSSIIAGFENTLLLLPTLSIFMPLILNMAGNSGTQSLGIVIRLFAKNELDEKKSIYKHLLNELLTGIVNGFIIAVMLFLIVIVFNLTRGIPFLDGISFALVIALSINIALIVSTVSGTVIPLIINLFKLDPAVASGPFITTINDILSLLIYFGLATLLINTLT